MSETLEQTEPEAISEPVGATPEPVVPAQQPASESQELGESGKKALNSERDARRKAETELTKLRKRLEDSENTGKSELQKIQDRVDELQRDADAAKKKAVVMQVIAETGLPADLADRLQGDDLETVRADAEKLVKYVASSSPATPTAGGARTPASQTRTPEEWRSYLRSHR
jgi:ElaB/YqjD/DUF883 family membrane-anchored ribosome-binding protein